MSNLADKHAPRKKKARNNYTPWLNNELKSLMAEQNAKMPNETLASKIVPLIALPPANCRIVSKI